MKQIREWLEKGQDYAQGLALYETYGKSRVVLNALRRGASDFTRQKLREALTALLQGAPAPVRVVDISAKRVDKTPERVHVGQVPADEALLLQRRTWYATRSHAYAQLELVATDAERRQLAADILAVSEKITASYAAQVPAVVEPTPDLAALQEEGEIRRLLANLRPQRSKLKKNPARAGDLARIEVSINLLEAKLKRDGEPQLHPRNRD